MILHIRQIFYILLILFIAFSLLILIQLSSVNFISFCIISTSCILNIYLFIYSVLADAKPDIIFRNLANYLNFTVSICVISESWSLYH